MPELTDGPMQVMEVRLLNCHQSWTLGNVGIAHSKKSHTPKMVTGSGGGVRAVMARESEAENTRTGGPAVGRGPSARKKCLY